MGVKSDPSVSAEDGFFDRLSKALEYLRLEARTAGQSDIAAVLEDAITKSANIYVERKRAQLELALRDNPRLKELKFD